MTRRAAGWEAGTISTRCLDGPYDYSTNREPVCNRRLYFSKVAQQQYTGPSPQAPVNRFTMLTYYSSSEQRNVACANQDVVYGMGALGLDLSPGRAVGIGQGGGR